ncbi:MAG: sulfate/molybdate ABC transporter ATP-binding protein [Kyrpidia sp.]|nr:sulfate/molybdate ABC transporter ATP-binding protein [Kyrpidia sp.]
MGVTLRSVWKTYKRTAVLQDVDLDLPTGKLVALLGPSGSGKTTLLRILAGLEVPDHGAVLFDGEDVTRRPPGVRRAGMVFQHYALFGHMTVFDNVAFGLRVLPLKNRPLPWEIDTKVRELIHRVRLDALESRYPSQLSGGQQQRVALARALAVDPRILLLDEPFAALDAKVRVELRRWLREFQRELGITTVFVTHDQEEATDIADLVVVVNQGRIEQVGSPSEIYERPASAFVFEFIGRSNVLPLNAREGKWAHDLLSRVLPDSVSSSETVRAYVRPHEIDVHRLRDRGTAVKAVVERVHPHGAVVRLVAREAGGEHRWEAEISRDRYEALKVNIGDTVYLEFRSVTIFTPHRKVVHSWTLDPVREEFQQPQRG